ncbi:DUF4760 domain-containing protein [Winogradskya humida]|uniref:Uncharacterized protein n=1 Tax=Winogradskya humida TaxID=113566 RepID=A0ABQ3ZWM2_9ACTN|nr:hypothetical protein [Actinoplanes humidus]GIE23012.1 hypothetical protein Ahu01nite_061140 [Actinoplanes humidus]
MDAKTVITVVTIAISLVSLTVSGLMAFRQIRTAVDGYALPVVLGVFSQFRTQKFFDAQQFLFDDLNRDFDPDTPYTDLPLAARSHIRMVAGLYDDLGKLVAHGIVREELVIGSNGIQARRIWEAVEPFVLAERRKRSGNLWIYLEDLAFRATRTPPQVIHAKLGLHRYTISTGRVLPRPRRKPPAPSDGG